MAGWVQRVSAPQMGAVWCCFKTTGFTFCINLFFVVRKTNNKMLSYVLWPDSVAAAQTAHKFCSFCVTGIRYRPRRFCFHLVYSAAYRLAVVSRAATNSGRLPQLTTTA